MKRYLIAGAIGLLVINVAVLDWWVFWGDMPSFARRVATVEERLDSVVKRNVSSTIQTSEAFTLDQVASMAAEQALTRLAEVSTPAPVVAEEEDEGAQTVPQEFFVPLGSGSTLSRDWVDAPAEATVDSSRYGTIEAVYFEAILSAVNGAMHARLVDKGNGLVYYDSELSNANSTPTKKTSQQITLGTGSRTYKVQYKSTVGEIGTMTNASLRILAK